MMKDWLLREKNILVFLNITDGETISELNIKLIRNYGGSSSRLGQINKLIIHLEDRGLITKSKKGREVRLSLTDKGKQHKKCLSEICLDDLNVI